MLVRRLTGPAELAAAAAASPFLRWGVDLGQARGVWRDADSGAFAVVRTRQPYGTSLVVTGEPVAAVELADHVAAGLGPGVRSVTLPRTAPVRPGPLLGPAPAGESWEWMWTASAPPEVAGEAQVAELDVGGAAAQAELAAFLAEHSPRHSAEPGDAAARVWLGIRDEDGGLLACVALYEAVPGVDVMASVAVSGAARGRGLGLAVTAAATRRSLRDRPPAATVDLYSDNDVARSLYAKLGYRLDQEFTSYPLGA